MATATREGKEGARWYNTRPSGEEITEWFRDTPLHPGMIHRDYISGVVLIQSKEKSKYVAGFDGGGLPDIREREDLVYVPYVKVETRVAYFWRWLEMNEDKRWEGEIHPVERDGGDTLGLPPGFFKYSAKGPQDKVTNFIGCSMQVRVWERSRTDSSVRAVISPPPATKIVPTASKWNVDENALMKAETGAIGRALGMAGMLVVPGSGVATAEDMQEHLNDPPAAAVSAEPELPVAAEEPKTDEELRERAADLVAELSAIDPARGRAFQEWARGRKLILEEAQGAALRGAVKKLQKAIDEADGQLAEGS